MDEEEYAFPWLDDQLYNKGRFLVQGMITEILSPLRRYGQNDYVAQAIIEIMKICDDWGIWVRGDFEKPLSLDYIRRGK